MVFDAVSSAESGATLSTVSSTVSGNVIHLILDLRGGLPLASAQW
jgi:hypothetical protein